jgi:putative DNA primase/helicase
MTPHTHSTTVVEGPPVAPVADAAYFTNLSDLFCRGWSLIPVQFGGKRPAVPWQVYQRRPATLAELEGWFERRRLNVGIVTGHVSGIFVLDADTPDALDWAESNMEPTDMRVRTGKGMHLYYPLSADVQIRNKTRIRVGAGGRIGLDIRADGGYVLGPGSVHPSGAVYTREGSDWRLR